MFRLGVSRDAAAAAAVRGADCVRDGASETQYRPSASRAQRGGNFFRGAWLETAPVWISKKKKAGEQSCQVFGFVVYNDNDWFSREMLSKRRFENIKRILKRITCPPCGVRDSLLNPFATDVRIFPTLWIAAQFGLRTGT